MIRLAKILSCNYCALYFFEINTTAFLAVMLFSKAIL